MILRRLTSVFEELLKKNSLNPNDSLRYPYD